MPETRPWTARHPLACAACACAAALSPLPALAASADPQTVAVALPTLAELEDAGAVIGEIRVVPHDIFDTDDPAEDKLPFRVANALHIRTRTSVVRDALLFKSGDRVSVRTFDETERALRSTRYLYDVKFTVLAVRDNIADIEVSTRDTWTLDPGGSFGRAGGANSTRVGIKEYNLLGTGTIVSLGPIAQRRSVRDPVHVLERQRLRQPDRGQPQPCRQQRRSQQRGVGRAAVLCARLDLGRRRHRLTRRPH